MKYLSVYSAVIPAFLFVYYSSRNKLKEMQVLFVYVTLSFIFDLLLINHPQKIYPILSYVLYSLFTITEYSLYALFLLMVIKNKYFRHAIVGVSIVFIVFATLFIFNANAQKTFDSLPASVEAIIIIVFSILFLFDQLNNPEVIIIYESHRFWIISTFLLYMAGGLFLWINAEHLTKVQKDYYWTIQHTINTAKNILLSIAFIMKKDVTNIHPSSLRKSYNI